MSIGTDTFFKTERRAFAVELRAVAKGRRLEGYAATFDSEARFNGFSETIKRGAFRETLSRKDDVLALVDHDPGKLLARTRSGTLRLSEDTRGLAFDLDLPDTSIGRDVLALAERADLGGMSFAFIPLDEHWDGAKRELRSVELKEISVVSAWPAYAATEVVARSQAGTNGVVVNNYTSGDTLIIDVVKRHVSFPRFNVARRYIESL